MLIAQITDLHVVVPGTLAYGKVDTNAHLAAAIERLNRLSPAPDVVIATGDLTDHGRPEEYDMLRELLARSSAPVYVVIGNHDVRENFRTGLRRYAHVPQQGHIQYVADEGPVRIIALDSTSDSSHHGDFCAARATWLEERLLEEPQRPTIVALHHPPFATGIAWMDGVGAGWADPLVAVLARHPQVIRVICGHLHRPIVAEVGGRIVSVAPSTAHQVAMDLSPEFDFTRQLPEFELEEPGLHLHLWDGRRLLTHQIHVTEWDRLAPIGREALDQLIAAGRVPGAQPAGAKSFDF
jgi:Icc protein